MSKSQCPTVTSAPLPKSFGRYEVIQLLGSGAMGAVYLAQDPVLDRKVALKVIAVDPMLNKGNRDEYLLRFSTEARASARLNHPAIVQVYDAGDENGAPWIAFQFVEGHSLEALLKQRGKLPVNRAVAFVSDIAAALDQAHASNIIHRDIKPANILIEARSGTAKLADFGVVKAPWTTMTQEGETLGSPGYMSPEQIEGSVLDARADLFSLGVVLYQTITGIHPFLRDTVSATVYATCSGVYKPVRDIVSDVPMSVESALRRCLASDKANRVNSALELIRLLNDTAQAQSPALPIGTSTPVSRSVIAPAGRVMVGDIKDTPLTFVQRIGSVVTRLEIPQHTAAVIGIVSRYVKPMMPLIVRIVRQTTAFVAAGAGHIAAIVTPSIRKKLQMHGMAYVMRGSVVGLLVCTVLFVVSLIVNAPINPPGGSREANLVAVCDRALAGNDRDLAIDSVEALLSLESECAMTRLMIARVMLRDGQVDNAAKEINVARRLKKGKAAIKHEKKDLLIEIGRRFAKGSLSAKLVDMVVYSLAAARHPMIRRWAEDADCQLRSGAVKVLNAGDVKIDMVRVYLLDLSCDDAMDIRINAVRRLGELRVQRAVPMLKKVAARGFNDPFVALEAKQVLEQLGN